MADFFDELNEQHQDFINAQPMFFTATAAEGARINLSPKGMDGVFKIFSPKLCGYLDLTGSGNETSAHIKNDGRITLMFNSFTRNALILRIYGKGRVVRPHHADFEEYNSAFASYPGVRQVILVDIESIQTSCGYGVPTMEMTSHRDTLTKWVESKGEEGIRQYQEDKNTKSIDGFDAGLHD